MFPDYSNVMTVQMQDFGSVPQPNRGHAHRNDTQLCRVEQASAPIKNNPDL
jgi:hypothetical protein